MLYKWFSLFEGEKVKYHQSSPKNEKQQKQQERNKVTDKPASSAALVSNSFSFGILFF